MGVLEDKSVIMQWMARWAAMAYNRYARGTDGKTAYQRQTGRWCKSEVLPFGEKVLFRPLKKSGGKKDIMEIKWQEGIWLGHARSSSSALVGTSEGVVPAW